MTILGLYLLGLLLPKRVLFQNSLWQLAILPSPCVDKVFLDLYLLSSCSLKSSIKGWVFCAILTFFWKIVLSLPLFTYTMWFWVVLSQRYVCTNIVCDFEWFCHNNVPETIDRYWNNIFVLCTKPEFLICWLYLPKVWEVIYFLPVMVEIFSYGIEENFTLPASKIISSSILILILKS